MAGKHSHRRFGRTWLAVVPLTLAAAGIAIPTLVTPASADANPTTGAQLVSAFAAGGSVTLEADISIIVDSGSTNVVVPTGKSVDLDLNGFSLTLLTEDSDAGIEVGAGSTLTVDDSAGGGVLKAGGGTDSAGIGGNAFETAGTIHLNGGTVSAVSGGGGGAGIGGGSHGNGGTVTVDGATVIAQGIEAAAIGGGTRGNGGSLTVSSGSVDAEGEQGGGAGIGGGPQGNGGSVSISAGASVTVAGGQDAPGQTVGAGDLGTAGAAGFGSLTNAGTLTIKSGSTLTVPSGVTVPNTGTILGTVANGGTITGHDYALSFNATPGSGAPAGATIYAGRAVDAGLAFGVPTPPAGASFTGWFTASGSRVTPTTDLNGLLGSGPLAVPLSAHYATPTTVTTEAQLLADFAAGTPIALGGNITITDSQWPSVVAGGFVLLDLNGHALSIGDSRAGAPHPGIEVEAGSSLTIEDTVGGGTLHVKGGVLGAAIGSEADDDAGSITITGGAVTAIGNEGAAIGSGTNGASGPVTVSGGSVTAESFHAAGIGGGLLSKQGGPVLVTGGTVTATAGTNSAGIGGGDGCCEENAYVPVDGGSVTVTGGRVTATGDGDAAGIGGGGGGTLGNGAPVYPGGNGGSLTIGAGASVTVTPGTGNPSGAVGAGAGGSSFGSLSNAGTLTIGSGSTLTVPAGVTVSNTGSIKGAVVDNGSIPHHDYALTFDLNGATGTAAPMTVYAASVSAGGLALPTGIQLSNGKPSSGWFTARSGGTQVTDSTDLSALLGDGPQSVTLYAERGPVVTEAQLKQALSDGGPITLGADISVTDSTNLVVPGSSSRTIDLAGRHLTSNASFNQFTGLPGIEVPAGSSLTIEDSVGGGTLTAIGGIQAAGIGGGPGEPAGTVTIDGGSVSATGQTGAAGIGGGIAGAGGTVTIGAGAAVTASGVPPIGGGGGVAFGSLSNAGTLTIASGSTLVIPPSTTVSNTGTIIGAVTNDGTITGHDYTLTFDAGTGSNAPASLMVYAATAKAAGLTLSAPTPPAGSTFSGWQTPDGTPVTDTTDLGAALGTGPKTLALKAQYTGPAAITTPAELEAAFAAGGTVTLGGDITIDDGTHPAVPDNGSVVLDLHGFSLTISSVDANQAGIEVDIDSSLTVEDTVGGGSLDATGGDGGPGLGGSHSDAVGTIDLAGGSITATAGSGAAAIGGGHAAPGGSLTIEKGVPVTANGTIGAGADAAGDGPDWFGSLTNAGTLTIASGSTLVIPVGSTVPNTGTIIGAVEADGSVTGNAYDITFDAGDGSNPPAEVVIYAPTVAATGMSLGSPTPPAGASFTGWFPGRGWSSAAVTDSTDLADEFGPATSDMSPVSVALTAKYAAATQTITFDAPTGVTYGDADSDPGATASSGLPVTYTSSTSSVCTIVANELHVVAAGQCTVEADQDGDAGHAAAQPVTDTFTIDKASLTITADDRTMVSGGAEPNYGFTVESFVGNDGFITEPECGVAVPHTADSPPTYPITCTGADAGPDYQIGYVDGALTVNAATPTPSPDLLVSGSAGRDGAAGLAGSTVKGNVYVFAAVPSSDRLVVFSLDGKAFHTEASAPFDFNGTAPDFSADAYPTSSLPDGQHTISASITSSTGVVTSESATFTVANGAAGPPPVLQVSTHADRSSPVNLAGSTVSGSVDIFANVPTSDRAVVFSLDGKPFHSEASAPFDFNGTAPDFSADAYPTSSLPDGQHTISASITSSTGVVTSESATFTVADGGTPPASSTLQVSIHADRSSPTSLDSATLSGTVYVFDVPTTAVTSVQFFLDGKAFHTENGAPYDFDGTASDFSALPYSTASLAKGKHTITAVSTPTTGTTVTQTATFTVT